MDTHAFVSLMAEAGPAGIVGIAIAEKIFPLVPSYVVFVLLGMTVALGQGDLTMTVAAAAIGSTIGSLCWYGLGFALGAERSESFVTRFGRYIFSQACSLSPHGEILSPQSLLGHGGRTNYSCGPRLPVNSCGRDQSCARELHCSNFDRQSYLERTQC